MHGEGVTVFCRPGNDLLSHVLRQSTIGAEAFDGRVRDGIGSYRLAEATRPAKDGDGSPMTEEERVTSFVSVRLPRKQAGRHRYDEGMRPLTSVIGRVTFVVQCALKMSAIKLKRAISTGKLNALPRLHTRPINVVVYHGS